MAAALVTVPEASVHQYDGSMPWENYIRTAGKAGNMQPKAAANPVENGAYLALRCGVPTSNPGHVPASSFA
jgi:hypothetical protein